MKKQILLEQNSQEVLNIIDALNFYKDNAIKPKYKNLIEDQLENIGSQLTIQGVSVIVKDKPKLFNFGQEIKYDNKKAIITGMSNENEFIKIAIINDNNELEQIDIPIVLIDRT